MLVERDGHLRFEAEVRLQGMVAALATDGTTFSLYDARKNEVNHGPACPANVASLLRIPLAPADVAALLLGDVRLPDGAQPDKQVSWDAARGADVLVVRTRDGGALQLMFRGSKDADRALVAVVRTAASGARQWQAAFEDVKNAGGVLLPETIRFAEGKASFDDGVEILFKDRKLNDAARRERVHARHARRRHRPRGGLRRIVTLVRWLSPLLVVAAVACGGGPVTSDAASDAPGVEAGRDARRGSRSRRWRGHWRGRGSRRGRGHG